MPELNREDIIKALECCASPNYICGECPIDQKIKEDCVCGQFVSQIALNLIKQLTEEKVQIFEEIEKALKRKISRANPHFEKLENRGEDNLSKWGCEDVGYFKGVISTCEDIQDVVANLKKKYIGE